LVEANEKLDPIDFDQLDDLLCKLAFFERFTKSTRINIYKLAHYERFLQGQYVFHQGDQGDNLYIILKGSVNVKVNKVTIPSYVIGV
jgi:potassium-dependent mechanosensitive channel